MTNFYYINRIICFCKNRIKNISILILALVFNNQIATSYDFFIDGIYYYYGDNHEVSVAQGEQKYEGHVVIPDSIIINGISLRVTKIASNAFAECKNLLAVSLPKSVSRIGADAFLNCENLVNINLSNIVYFGDNSFKGCSNIESIDFIDADLYIGRSAFSNCYKLKSLYFPPCNDYEYEPRTRIFDNAFEYCFNVTSVYLSGRVCDLFDYAFANCGKIETLSFEDNGNSMKFFYEGGIINYHHFMNVYPKYVYIGRSTWPKGPTSFNHYFSPVHLDETKVLAIGKNRNSDLVSNCELAKKLEKVYVMIDHPLGSSDIMFNNSVYINAVLYVPKGKKEEYLQCTPWKNFLNIQEMDIEDMWHGHGVPEGYEDIQGDVNGDSEVNIADINAVINMILSSSSNLNGDVNHDLEINIADINEIINIILSN